MLVPENLSGVACHIGGWNGVVQLWLADVLLHLGLI